MTVQIYIVDNKDLFAKLRAEREEIEAELGLKLDWQELPERKASRIVISQPGDFLDEAHSQGLVVWMANTADTFAQVFPPLVPDDRVMLLPRLNASFALTRNFSGSAGQ